MQSTQIEHCIASGLGFTEGPIWTARDTLMCVGLSRGLVYEIDPLSAGTVAESITGGHPNGLALGPDGAVWIAQAGHGAILPCIQRMHGDEIKSFGGDFHAPNDLAFGPDGLLWFTDPAGQALEGDPEPGRIWSMDTASGTAVTVAEGALYPNGLAFAPDNDALFVAETATARILRYGYSGGALDVPTVFAQLQDGHPDGIAFDAEGNLLVAATTAGSIQVFDPAGLLVEVLALPPQGFATNLCFGGSNLSTLFVTSPKGGSVFAIDRQVPGLALL